MSQQNLFDMIGNIQAQDFLSLPPQIQEILIDTATGNNTASPLVESLTQRILPVETRLEVPDTLNVPNLTPSSTQTTPTPLSDVGHLFKLMGLHSPAETVTLLSPQEVGQIPFPPPLAQMVAQGGQVIEISPKHTLDLLEEQAKQLEPRSKPPFEAEQVAPTPTSSTSVLFDWSLAAKEGVVDKAGGDTPPNVPIDYPNYVPMNPMFSLPPTLPPIPQLPSLPTISIPKESPKKRRNPVKSVITTTNGKIRLDTAEGGIIANVPVHGKLATEPDQEDSLTVIIEGKNKFKCPTCHRAFNRMYNLKSHIKTHQNHRPFVCPMEGCGMAFTRNHDLTRHIRVHQNERPYQCEICHKGFARMDGLKKHQLQPCKEVRNMKPTSPTSPTGASPLNFVDQ